VNVGGGGEDAVSRFVTKSGPAAVDMMAKKIAMGGEAPVLGMMSKNEKSDIIAALNKRAAEFDTAQRMFIDDPKFDKNKPRAIPDLVSQKAKVHALTSELTKLKGMQGAVNSFSASADMNAQALTDTLDKLPEGGAKFLNAPLRDFASQFGDENMAAFGVFRNSVQNEYNRLISNPNLTGVVAQKSKDDMETLLNPNSPVKALRSALKALQKESKNRKIGLDNEVGSVEDEISGNPPKAKSVEDYRKKYNY
jgi:hypothetical protein